jgi:hypothetical protein
MDGTAVRADFLGIHGPANGNDGTANAPLILRKRLSLAFLSLQRQLALLLFLLTLLLLLEKCLLLLAGRQNHLLHRFFRLADNDNAPDNTAERQNGGEPQALDNLSHTTS